MWPSAPCFSGPSDCFILATKLLSHQELKHYLFAHPLNWCDLLHIEAIYILLPTKTSYLKIAARRPPCAKCHHKLWAQALPNRVSCILSFYAKPQATQFAALPNCFPTTLLLPQFLALRTVASAGMAFESVRLELYSFNEARRFIFTGNICANVQMWNLPSIDLPLLPTAPVLHVQTILYEFSSRRFGSCIANWVRGTCSSGDEMQTGEAMFCTDWSKFRNCFWNLWQLKGSDFQVGLRVNV